MIAREFRFNTCAPLGRSGLVVALRATSLMLFPIARRLAQSRPGPAQDPPLYEFHAEAGAPEGALKVDGQFVGHLAGVTRS